MENGRLDPSKHRVLLVGPRVVHLKPFFEQRRYQVSAVPDGLDGMTALTEQRHELALLELNLGDLTAAEFLMAARQQNPQASFLLLDDPSKSNQIVKTMQAGLDGYVPTPPDEDRLFFEVNRHLQRSMAARRGADHEDETDAIDDALRLQSAEARVHDLTREAEELRAQLRAARNASDRTGLTETTQLSELDGDAFDEVAFTAVKARPSDDVDRVSTEVEGAKLAQPSGDEATRLEELGRENQALQRRLEDETRARRALEAQLEHVQGPRTAPVPAPFISAESAHHTSPDALRGARVATSGETAKLDRDAAVDRALDLELQLDEMRERIAARERALEDSSGQLQRAEQRFRQDRLRLVEEKEEAASGKQQTFETLERRQQEIEALRRQNGVLEERLRIAEERGAAIDERARLRSMEGHSLAAAEEEARGLLSAAQGRISELEHAAREAEAQAQRRDEELRQAREDALAAVNSTASRLFDLEQAHQITERELLDAQRRLREADADLHAARRRIGELVEELRLEQSRAGPPAGLLEERDRLRGRLAETEQWIAQAQPHIEALRSDRDRATAQLQAVAVDAQRRARELEDARQQAALLRQQLEALASRQVSLEQERDRAASGGSVVEATEPLRWGLNAAIEHLTTLEGKNPQLSTHLRHLRLLESTLARLSNPG